MPYAGKGQLLTDVLTVEQTADGVAHYQWYPVAEQETSAKHWLKDEAAAHRERHAPNEVGRTYASPAFPPHKIVRMISKPGLKHCASCGEEPAVFRIIVEVELITVNVQVVQTLMDCRLSDKNVVEIVEVGKHTYVAREVAYVETYGLQV